MLDPEICIICHEDGKLVRPQPATIQKLETCVNALIDDHSFQRLSETKKAQYLRMKRMFEKYKIKEPADSMNVKWHKSCYTTATSSDHLVRGNNVTE